VAAPKHAPFTRTFCISLLHFTLRTLLAAVEAELTWARVACCFDILAAEARAQQAPAQQARAGADCAPWVPQRQQFNEEPWVLQRSGDTLGIVRSASSVRSQILSVTGGVCSGALQRGLDCHVGTERRADVEPQKKEPR
jgi:hypothetical protein